jgi:hypothetical protein
MAQTTTGTNRMRASVMRFGMLKRFDPGPAVALASCGQARFGFAP